MRLFTATVVVSAGLICSYDVPAKTFSEIITASASRDWRAVDDNNTLYLSLSSGLVVIELAPQFAPHHVANIKTLAQEGYYDGLAILRSQDNYVVQWADPAADTSAAKPVKKAKRNLDAEYTVKYDAAFAFTPLPDVDGYASIVGHSNGFAAARDPNDKTTWLTHCYGAVGVSRGSADNSGDGTSLYVVTGHAPRHLDRNITVVGRVLIGMEWLSSLPRGSGALGFYSDTSQYVPINTVKLATELTATQRLSLEVLRTDSATFSTAIESLRNRTAEWYKRPAGHVELCNVNVPVRQR
jgi:cyclophilin family peptidyl-prolyl cis-trans isomerase